MAKIAVVGMGTIGVAFAKIALAVTNHDVILVDNAEPKLLTGLTNIIAALSEHVAERIEVDSLAEALKTADLLACCVPYQAVIPIAQVALAHGLHYLDFTEDNEVKSVIEALEVKDLTFVPQTGVAPGLINYLGLSLVKSLLKQSRSVKHLKLGVGALPRVPDGPGRYAITWSPAGLINEYLKPVKQKVNGHVVTVEPLQDLETVTVNGVEYEAFTTSGGVGDLIAYEDVPNVEYKTLRYPGHLSFIKELLAKVNYDQEKAVELAERTFTRTRDDVVVLSVQCVLEEGEVQHKGGHFYPNLNLDLTAIELTTAATGVAVAELALSGRLQKGVLKPHQVPLDKLLQTNAGKLLTTRA